MSLRLRSVSFATCAAALLMSAPGCKEDDGLLDGDDDTTTTTGATTTTTDGRPGTTTDGAPGTTTDAPPGTTEDAPPGTTDGDTGPALGCGNGQLDPGEECDGAQLGGATCLDVGFDDGTLACSATCALDLAGCYVVEALQNDNGMCDYQELGCTDDLGSFGNPQDLLECYESSLTPPLQVIEVQYSIGDTAPLPTALQLVVHEWAGPGEAPGALLGMLELSPETDLVIDLHTLVLPTPIDVPTATFCVGFRGEDPSEGFRLDFTDADNLGESWVRADACGAAAFTEATDISYPGNFCIRPTVTSREP